MPRGESPNSRANLKLGTPFDAETARKAKEKSDDVKRELKSFRQLDSETTTSEERQAMLDRLKLLASKGNIKAMELYLKIIGEYEQSLKVSAEVTNRSPLAALSLTDIKELISDA